MSPYVILCIHENKEILSRLTEDLAELIPYFELVTVTSAQLGIDRLDQLKQQDKPLCTLICQPSLFIELENHPANMSARKILLAEQTEVTSIIDIVNKGRLDYVLTSPWRTEELASAIKEQLTQFIVEHDNKLLHYTQVLDQAKLVNSQLEKQVNQFKQGFLDYSQYSDRQLSKLVFDALYQIFAIGDETHVCRKYSANHLLTKEGETNDFLWFIAKGEVLLKKRDSAGQQQEVSVLQGGGMVAAWWEECLLPQEKRPLLPVLP